MIKKMTNKYLVTSHIIFFVNRIIDLLNCNNKIEELVLSLRVVRKFHFQNHFILSLHVNISSLYYDVFLIRPQKI